MTPSIKTLEKKNAQLDLQTWMLVCWTILIGRGDEQRNKTVLNCVMISLCKFALLILHMVNLTHRWFKTKTQDLTFKIQNSGKEQRWKHTSGCYQLTKQQVATISKGGGGSYTIILNLYLYLYIIYTMEDR